MAKRSRKSSVPENETKRQRFVRVISLRLPRALSAVNRLGGLSSTNYEFSDDDVAKIKAALEGAVSGVVDRFQHPTKAGVAIPTFE